MKSSKRVLNLTDEMKIFLNGEYRTIYLSLDLSIDARLAKIGKLFWKKFNIGISKKQLSEYISMREADLANRGQPVEDAVA